VEKWVDYNKYFIYRCPPLAENLKLGEEKKFIFCKFKEIKRISSCAQ
jgi:hypothetical protein